jgi:hypothetical protein
MLESFHDSPWHNPLSFWLGGLALLAVVARLRGYVRRYLLVFTVAIAIDAFLSGALSPLRGAPPAIGTTIAFVFVLLGDLRYFLLLERFARPQGYVGRALALAMVVPVLVLPVRLAALPDRVLWLTYEVLFVALAVALRTVVLPRRLRRCPAASRRFLLALTTFQILQYGLWASADALLLRGVGLGWGLRVAANTLYYVGFLAFVALRVPAEAEAA